MECGGCGAEITDPPADCPECGERVEGDDWDPLAAIIAENTPLGIKVICVLELLGIFFLFATAGQLLEAGRAAGDMFIQGLGWVVVGLAVFNLVKVAGLWTLKRWGYTIAVFLYGFGCFLGVVLLLPAPATGVAYILVYGLFWWYVHSKRRFYGVH